MNGMTRMRTAAMPLIAVAAAAAVFGAPPAHAASNVGRSAPATVYCDFMTNQITIRADISASESYDTQRVAYELYLRDVLNGTWTRLNINGQRWDVLLHKRVTWTREFSIMDNAWIWTKSISPSAPTSWLTYKMPDGRYEVWTRYIWEVGLNSGTWVDANGARFTDSAPWSITTSYSAFGFPGYSSACSL